MKYIKSAVLLLLLLLLSGCTINYNLDVDAEFIENIFVKDDTLTVTKEMPLYFDDLSNLSEVDEKVDGYKYYDLTKGTSSSKYSTTYKASDFTKITSCNLLFDKCEFINIGGGESVISTTTGTGIFESYPGLEEISINLTINGEVVYSNADSVNGDIYTWKINSGNAYNKSVYVKFKDKFKSNSETKSSGKSEKEKAKENLIYLSILLVVLIGLLVLAITLKKKQHK